MDTGLDFPLNPAAYQWTGRFMRFLRREQADWPDLPRNYLDDASAAAFAELRAMAGAGGSIERRAGEVAAAAERMLANTWRPGAIRLYANWLDLVARRRAQAATGDAVLRTFGDGAARGPAGEAELAT